MLNSAIITPVLAAGSVASPYLFQVNVSQRLCVPTCVGQTPVFNPVFSLVGFSQVGANAYVATVNVQGLISYTPCRTNDCCCTRTQVLNQNFTIPFYSAAAPTAVSIAQGVPVNSVSAQPCQTCSRAFVSETPVTLTVAAAS